MPARAGVIVHGHEGMLAHDPGAGHVESPQRLRAILDSLRAEPIPGSAWRSPSPASRDQLARVHRHAYVDHVLGLHGRSARLDPDTAVSPGSIDAALLSAGAAVSAVDAAIDGECPRGFALTRPPGHHAEPERAMGFCLFNNVAIAAAHARARGLGRVMILDWDVHHGNGTQAIFERDPGVVFISIHESRNYPGTGMPDERGEEAGYGATFNLPLEPGAGDDDYAFILRALVGPIAERLRPELVLVSAGFDAHAADPLGGMTLSAAGFGAMTRAVRRIAEAHADGRLVLVLEGGYDIPALVESVRACLTELARGASGPEESATAPAGESTRRIVEFLRTEAGIRG